MIDPALARHWNNGEWNRPVDEALVKAVRRLLCCGQAILHDCLLVPGGSSVAALFNAYRTDSTVRVLYEARGSDGAEYLSVGELLWPERN